MTVRDVEVRWPLCRNVLNHPVFVIETSASVSPSASEKLKSAALKVQVVSSSAVAAAFNAVGGGRTGPEAGNGGKKTNAHATGGLGR